MKIYLVTPYCLQGRYDYELVNVQFMKNFAKKETIVDNGVFEMFHVYGKEVDFDDVVSKQYEISKKRKDVKIVLPDYPNNMNKTVELVEKYASKYDFDRRKLIGVIQININDIDNINNIYIKYNEVFGHVSRLLDFYEDLGIRIVAIPIKLRKALPMVVDVVVSLWNIGKIHLLGFGLNDIKFFREYGFKFRSMDTSYPIKCKMLNLRFGDDSPRPKDYFDRNVEYVDVEEFRRWLNERVGRKD